MKINVFLLILIFCHKVYAGIGGFYVENNRYKGFYWFERKKKVDSLKFHYPTKEEAKEAINNRKETIEDARNQMIELAFRDDVPQEILRDAIIKYKTLESKMYDSTIRLVNASEMVNFTNPEIANLVEFPTNVFANKIKRTVDEEEKILKIKDFASKFDLLLFANDSCPYCKAFAPVIDRFAQDQGFILNITSLNSKEGKIAQKLGIKVVPTLVAVSKDAKELFEISRGFISISELESNILLASNHSEEQRLTKKRGKNSD